MILASAATLPPARRFAHLAPHRLVLKLAPAEVWPDAARMTIAAVASLLASHALHLPGTFAVLTTLMVTRQGAGGGFKSVLDRLIGMALGVAVGLVLVTARHWRVPDAVLVAIAMLPLCIVVARFKRYQAAPIGAILVLSAGVAITTALHTALLRVGEICLGAAIGIAVSAIVFRRPGEQSVRHHAARVLTGCGALLTTIATRGVPPATDFALRERIRNDLRLVMVSGKAVTFRRRRTLDKAQVIALGRLQTDVIFIGRALADAQPPWRTRTQPVLERIADAFQDLCDRTAGALTGTTPPPSFASFDAAVLMLRQQDGGRDMARIHDAAMALPFLLSRLRADLLELLAGADS